MKKKLPQVGSIFSEFVKLWLDHIYAHDMDENVSLHDISQLGIWFQSKNDTYVLNLT